MKLCLHNQYKVILLFLVVITVSFFAKAENQYNAINNGDSTPIPKQSRIYIKPFVGHSFFTSLSDNQPKERPNKTFSADENFLFGGALGYHLNEMADIELEVSYTKIRQKAKIESNTDGSINATQKVDSTSLFVNGYLFAKNSFMGSRMTPFVTAGVGVVYNDPKGYVITTITANNKQIMGMMPAKSKTRFAAQAGAGILINVDDLLSVESQLKYVYRGMTRNELTVDNVMFYQLSKLHDITGTVGLRATL